MIRRLAESHLRQFPEYAGHESVFSFANERYGLNGFVAIHNTALGPATGGTRFFSYDRKDDALRDALLLSQAMTYKCAVAGVPHGGGKAVIFKTDTTEKTADFMRAYASEINMLDGRFTTGPDVGITTVDVAAMAEASPYINWLPGGASDPSPWAARSVFLAIGEAAGWRDMPRFSGLRVGVKGVGKVGSELLRLLGDQDAVLFAADTDRGALRRAAGLAVFEISDPALFHASPMDVYAPCAMGGEFTADRAAEVGARVVCGGANNQLADPDALTVFHDRGILYIPDYLANAGGLINIVDALGSGGYSQARVEARIQALQVFLREILKASSEENTPVALLVDEFVRSRVGIRY